MKKTTSFFLLPIALFTILNLAAHLRAAKWYKGNIHCHTVWSDGNTLPELAVDWYRTHGYQFLSLTDHSLLQLDPRFWKETKTDLIKESKEKFGDDWLETKDEDGKTSVRLKTYAELAKKFDDPGKFLLIPGHEQNIDVAGHSLHTNALNIAETIPFPSNFPSVVEAALSWRKASLENSKKNGLEGFWMLNHPDWSYYDISPEVLIEASEIEFYENCNTASGPRQRQVRMPDREKYWDIVNAFRLLDGKKPVYGVASDDAHEYIRFEDLWPNPGNGWIVVRSKKLEANALFRAMKRGDFYSSTGICLKDIRFDPATRTLTVDVDPAENVRYMIRFVGTKKGFDKTKTPIEVRAEGKLPALKGFAYSDEIGMTFQTTLGTSASYKMEPDDLYVRAIITSNRRPHYVSANKPEFETAWTQPVGWSADASAGDIVSSEPEASLSASNVKPEAVVMQYTASRDETISGFFIRLANCIGPRTAPVVAGLRVRGELLPERVEIPDFPAPIIQYTQTGGKAQPPLDIGQEYRRSIEPIDLKTGESVVIEIVSAPPMRSGVTCGLQIQGTVRLNEMRNPFRETRLAGPVSRLAWSAPELLAIGNHIAFDPECAPQNNSSIIADQDGTLYQFTAYYSVDEQYGGGRKDSTSRIYGFYKKPQEKSWKRLGLIVDVPAGKTYAGDPFVFYDLDDTPCMAYTTCDGTMGFIDWKLGDLYVMRSKTGSFAGPWGEPHALFQAYPREPDDNKNGGRANCARIYTRKKTRDYLLVWNHGVLDMHIRGLVVPNLETTLSHREIGDAPILIHNQEEGGGGFQFGNKGYYSTWQIPGVNDPTGIQRVYEVDLEDPLNPESWRIVPGSLGFNDGSAPDRDGGCTADAWAVSKIGDELWATACEWSVSNKKNYLVALRSPWKSGAESLSFKDFSDGTFRFGVSRVNRFDKIVPVVEYALGKSCSLECSVRSEGHDAGFCLLIGPSSAPLTRQCLGIRLGSEGTRFVMSGENDLVPLSDPVPPRWKSGREDRIKLRRQDKELIAYVNGKEIARFSVEDPEHLQWLNESPRFKLYGFPGSRYELRETVLTDGPEVTPSNESSM